MRTLWVSLLGFCLVLLVSPGSTPYAQSPTKMYWADHGTNKIQRANMAVSPTVDDLVTGLTSPYGIAVDFQNTPNKVYWTDYGTRKIQRRNVDGSGEVETLVTLPSGSALGDIALDLVNNKMYWADRGTNKIQRANMAVDPTVEDLVTTGLSAPDGIALDVPGGKMYWTDWGTYKIQRADMADGGSVQDLVTTGLSSPDGIALDVSAGKMYWTDAGTKKIQRADMADGGSVQDLVTGLTPYGIALDVSAGKMYWTDYSTKKIQRADMADGGSVQDLVTTGLSSPFFIALDYNDASLPVELSSFTATAGDGEVTLHWVTESEVDNLGFHVYRALSEDGEYERLTAELIEGAGTASSSRDYAFTDVRLTNGVTYWYQIEDVAFNGTRTMHGPICVTPQAEVLAEVQALPTEFGLSQNVPNPFNPATSIAYDLPEAGDVTLIIYTVTGQQVATLVSSHQEAGHYEVAWDGSDFANGVYLYCLEAGDFVETRRMVLVK